MSISFEWKKILLAAVLLRLLIMPFYFHPDIKTYHFQVSFLQKGVTNIYSYLQENKSQLPLREEFVYFPLTYFFLGGYQILAQPLLGEDFHSWLFDASGQASESSEVFRYLFILKFPYLLLDILIGFLLVSFFKDQGQKRTIFSLWLFNPASLLLIYAYGNLDIIVVTLTLGSLFFALKNRFVLSALLLGIGAGFKAYPLLFVPFLLLAGRNYKERVGILVASLGTFALIIGPFFKTASFREATLTSGLMTRITQFGISLGFNEILMGVIVICSFVFFGGLSKAKIAAEDLWHYYLAVLLIVLSFIHFHIQWIVWLLPFFVILAQKQIKLIAGVIVWTGLAIFIPWLYDDKAMTAGLLSTINPFFRELPTPFTLVQKVYNPYLLQSIFHSILAGGGLYIIWQLFKGKGEDVQ